MPRWPPGRVLVIRPGGIGDAVLLLPSLRVLRERFPSAEIDVLAEARNAEIFTFCEPVTTIFLYHRVRDLIRVFRQSYDLVIDTEQWHRLSAVVAFLTRAPVRVGFATNDRARLFSHRVPYDQETYEVLSFLQLLGSVTGQTTLFDQEAPFVAVSPRYVDPIRSRPLVVISPGASIREKMWGGERFAELAARLVEEDCVVTVVGSEAERKQARLISSSWGTSIIDLVGQLSLQEVAAVLAGADALVTPDSGLLHLAYAVGTPTVALFGASNPKKWAPRGRNHRTLSTELPCSPCSAFGYTPPCAIGIECLRRILVEDVLNATLEVIAQGRPRIQPDTRGESSARVRSVVTL